MNLYAQGGHGFGLRRTKFSDQRMAAVGVDVAEDDRDRFGVEVRRVATEEERQNPHPGNRRAAPPSPNFASSLCSTRRTRPQADAQVRFHRKQEILVSRRRPAGFRALPVYGGRQGRRLKRTRKGRGQSLDSAIGRLALPPAHAFHIGTNCAVCFFTRRFATRLRARTHGIGRRAAARRVAVTVFLIIDPVFESNSLSLSSLFLDERDRDFTSDVSINTSEVGPLNMEYNDEYEDRS